MHPAESKKSYSFLSKRRYKNRLRKRLNRDKTPAEAVEIDGDSHLGKEEYDAERTQQIAKDGIEVIRFRNEEVLLDVASVWARIQKRCKERRAEKQASLPSWHTGKYCCPHCGKELPEDM